MLDNQIHAQKLAPKRSKMKRTIIILALLIGIIAVANAISIYEIQYTNNPGVDNSYPSPYVGKDVTLEGIVTGTDHSLGGYFISEPISGPWRGIFISDKRNRPSVGDKIMLRGKVHEHFGMTCLKDISSFRTVTRNYGTPQPLLLTTGQLSRSDEAEAYEGVYVRLIGASVSSAKSKGGRFFVTDGSGPCAVLSGSFANGKKVSPATGTQFSNIVGIVIYSFSEFSLNPIGSADMQLQQPVSTQNRSWGRIKSIYK